MLEQHVIAQEGLFGCNYDAGSTVEDTLETASPGFAREADARLYEVRPGKWKHDLRLGTRILQRFEKQDVGAARRLRVADRGPKARNFFAQRDRDSLFDVSGESW